MRKKKIDSFIFLIKVSQLRYVTIVTADAKKMSINFQNSSHFVGWNTKIIQMIVFPGSRSLRI